MLIGSYHSHFLVWNRNLAAILDNPLTGKLIGKLLASIVEFDFFMIFLYTEGKAVSVSHNVDAGRKQIVIEDYLNGPFLLDPFYTNSLLPKKTGFMDMRELSPDQFHKSEFYRHHYHLTGIADEIGVSVPISKNASCVVSITRHVDDTRFAKQEKELFMATEPVISLLCRRLLEKPVQPSPDMSVKKIEDAFEDFGKKLLSPREIEIVTLILKGHSSLSIGELLGISTGTVKIHRKNIYSKLNISSQAELFNRFIRYFTAP